MEYNGVIRKMNSYTIGNQVHYSLEMDKELLEMNQLIGRKVQLTHTGYSCLHCHDPSKKIFRQGLCYEHFYNQPQSGDWVMKPELSKAHLNIEDRNLEYEKKAQLVPHIVYIANSGTVKVGVTRKSQIPTRWIDQGAHNAIPILEAPNRYLAGITEVALKNHISDKTNWRKMLKNDIENQDLQTVKETLLPYIPEETRKYIINNNENTILNFPVQEYPKKINSISFDKTNSFEQNLIGIKGQYLLFENDMVFNLRKHEGYRIILNIIT